MKTDKKMENIQAILIKIITENNIQNREEIIRKIEEIGLDNQSAQNLIDAYNQAEEAKKASKNAWNVSLENRIDYSPDIAQYQQRELETRQKFDEVKDRCALLMVANRMDPNQMDDELLAKLYQRGISADEITSPAVRIAFYYYSKSKLQDNEKRKETDDVKTFSAKVKEQVMLLKAKYRELERENKALKKSYEKLQSKYNARVISDEKHYQTALSQITTLKKKIKRLENKSVFQVVGDRLKDVFGNKKEKLPEPMSEIPDTLYESVLEKVKIEGFQEDSKTKITDIKTKKITEEKIYEEWQQ